MDYDLEQAIMVVWATCDDLKLFAEEYYDGQTPMTVDETFNNVEGIRSILELRMRKLYDCYKRDKKLDQYCTDPEKLAAREQFISQLLTSKKKGKK